MKKIFLTLVFIIFLVSIIYPQTPYFRRAIFLHRSVGGNIYGPNGSSTSVPKETYLYNIENNYIDEDSVYMYDEGEFPINNSGNHWCEWRSVFDRTDPDDDIYQYIEDTGYDIIIINSGYPNSGIWFYWYEGPQDTINYPCTFSIYNYQWHIRSIVNTMKQYPMKFFVMWTLAPLLQVNTTSQQAIRDNWFSTWMKDTLATGLDTLYGSFPHNVYIFDYFHKVVDENYYLRPEYAVSATDNHPNAAATELVAPQFVQEVFDAAIIYEENYPLPVELSAFSAKIIGSAIQLNWRTEIEVDNYGFEVERCRDTEWRKIGFVQGHGNSNSPKSYNFEDKNLIGGSNFKYRLKQVDTDGQFEYSNIIEVEILLNKFALFQNYPNPFNPSTVIEFSLPEDVANVKLSIYNALGEKVAELVNTAMIAGKYQYQWNAQDVATGMYIYELRTDKFVSVKKMILMK